MERVHGQEILLKKKSNIRTYFSFLSLGIVMGEL